MMSITQEALYQCKLLNKQANINKRSLQSRKLKQDEVPPSDPMAMKGIFEK